VAPLLRRALYRAESKINASPTKNRNIKIAKKEYPLLTRKNLAITEVVANSNKIITIKVFVHFQATFKKTPTKILNKSISCSLYGYLISSKLYFNKLNA